MVFNERAFLIRSLVGVFLFQFITVGYLAYSCQISLGKEKETEKVSVVCNNASNAFNETGKLALATILALLVPSEKQSGTPDSTPVGRRKKTEKEEADPPV